MKNVWKFLNGKKSTIGAALSICAATCLTMGAPVAVTAGFAAASSLFTLVGKMHSKKKSDDLVQEAVYLAQQVKVLNQYVNDKKGK
jgi:hypothetical protein